MSHPADSEAINTGAINHVSFPGAEAGLLLVQPVALVTVTGTITGVYRILNTKASTTAKATPKAAFAGFARRVSLTATTGKAVVAATARSKARRSISATARATGRATSAIKGKFGTATIARANPSTPLIRVRVQRSIASTGKATASVSSRKRVFVFPTRAEPKATAFQASALRKRLASAQTVGQAAQQVAIRLRIPLSSATVGEAIDAPATALRKIRMAATTGALSIDSVTPYIHLLRSALTDAVAAPAQIDSSAIVPRAAATQASATGVVKATIKISVSGYTLASFASYVVALDYAINPAPSDRQMVVQSDERRMEVVAT